MSSIIITNINQLLQVDRLRNSQNTPFLKGENMAFLPRITNAWLHIDHGKILDYGTMSKDLPRADYTIDATGRFVLPSWIDSHTHIVFAKPRSKEFVDRINGLSYEDIAKRGGGILNSAKHLAEKTETELFESALIRLYEIAKTGTGYVEIKSGYGLSVQQEIKMLKVIKRLKKVSPIPIATTFLAAHAIPKSFQGSSQDFVDEMIQNALPKIADQGLADYIDIFCEKGYFSAADVERLLEAGDKVGLRGKIHTNQFNHVGGIEAAIKKNALSVDHLEVLNDTEISLLKKSKVIPTLLPSAPFFLNDSHFPPMRKMIDAGLGFNIATDFNPGSTPSGNFPFLISLACIKGRITPEEAINASTYNAAFALEIQDQYGSIDRGKMANFIITEPMDDLSEIPYYFGKNPVWKHFIKGIMSDSC